MLLHDLVDIKNGRVITKDVIAKDDENFQIRFVQATAKNVYGKDITFEKAKEIYYDALAQGRDIYEALKFSFKTMLDSNDSDPNYYDMVVAVSRSSNNVKGNKEYTQRVIESKMKSSGVLFDQTKFDQAYSDFRKAPASRAAFYKNPEDSKSVKDQIAELESQKEQAKKMGYGTDAYDAAIANLQKDAFSQPLTVKEIKSLFQNIDPTYAKMLSGVVTSKQMAVRKGLEVGLKLSSEGARFKDSALQKDDNLPDKCSCGGYFNEIGHEWLGEDKNGVGRSINTERCSRCNKIRQYMIGEDGSVKIVKDSTKDESNIKEMEAGKSREQAIAIAMSKAGKTKDTDIVINISDNPDEPEVSFDSLHYNGYNIKQIKETGEFDIYDLGGAIIGHTATLELAKIFIDNKGRSIIGQTE